jgi:hypothetical protein
MSNRIKIVLLIAFIGLLALATSAQAQSTSIQLGCTGQLIEPTAKTSSPKMLQLTISSGRLEWTSGPAVMPPRSKATTRSNSNSVPTNSQASIFTTPEIFSLSTRTAILLD